MSEPAFQSLVIMHPKFNSIQRDRHLSRLLDNAIAIPGTRFRIGLDPIIGLIPGAGDFVGTASAYIVIEAARLGLPKSAVGQMVFNILLESVVGAVPVVGEEFDFAWKANLKNIELLETHLGVTKETQKASGWFIFLLTISLFIVCIGLVCYVLIIRLLLNAASN